ncbi:MAG: hypothetical protein Q8O23_04005, partial [Gallionella sp.]|nr:hypothetical protein [Gallionella sp.]
MSVGNCLTEASPDDSSRAWRGTGGAVLNGPELSPPLRVNEHGGGLRAETAGRALEVGDELQLRIFLKKDEAWTTLSPPDGLPPAF